MHSFFDLKIETLFEIYTGLEFIDNGPLRGPIKDKSIKFNEQGKIELTTVSSESLFDTEDVKLNKSAKNNKDSVILEESTIGLKVELKGVQKFRYSMDYSGQFDDSKRTEFSYVEEVFCQISQPEKNYRQIEYISNITDSYHFPDFLISNNTIINQVVMSNEFLNTDLRIETKKNGVKSTKALYLNVDGIGLYLITFKESGFNKGVIIYEEHQPADVRDKIRDCISFCLGKRINYHGYLIIDNNRQIEFSYISNRFTRLKSDYPSLMPTALGKGCYQLNSIESNVLVNALYKDYDRLNLKHIFWIYWNGLEAPLHMAGAYFGACIEAFQKIYTSVNPTAFSTKLIDSSNWKILRAGMLKVLESVEVPELELEELKNKVGHLNQTPQRLMMERLFSELGLKRSRLEISAWNERNNAAHGNIVEPQNYKGQLESVKILRCLFHRLLLKATKGSDSYFDFYTSSTTLRNLTDPIS